MNSIRSRLFLASHAILFVFGALTFVALDRSFQKSAIFAQEEKMKGLVYSVLGATDVDEAGRVTVNEFALQNPDLLAAVLDEKARALWKSAPYKSQLAGTSSAPVGEWVFLGPQRDFPFFLMRLGVTWIFGRDARRTLTIVVGEEPSTLEHQLRIYRTTLAWWLAAAVALVLLALRLVLRWGLRPLRTTAEELDAIRSGKADAVSENVPKELAPVTEGLNSLLRHERAQQKRYRNALDDLAHSLKTPLAALRGMAAPRMADQIHEIDKVLEYQVRRASTAGRTVFAQPLPLRATAEKLVGALTKVYRDKGIHFEVRVPETLFIQMDEGDLMEVAGNLLDNASKWCRSQVLLTAQETTEGVEIQVEDDGPGFPKDGRRNLLERGVRADRRVPGEGIGLAVVQSIVTVYEGTLELADSPLGGARVRVTL